MARSFRFGVLLSKAATRRAWLEKVRRVEDLGYTVLLVPDHFDDQLAPISALAMAAEHSGLRIGTLVLDNDYRHPVVVAKQAATIDLLTEGRLELGLGAGWMRTDYEQAGMPYDAPSVRIDRFQESLAVLKGILRGGRFTFEGRHYRITDHEGSPRPVQQPHPPLLIGAGGKRMLGIAAREADIIGVNPSYAEGVFGPAVGRDASGARTDRKLGWIREAAGERFDDIELSVLVYAVVVTRRRRRAAKDVASRYFVPEADVMDFPHALIGTVDQIAGTIRRRRDRWGISYYIVGEAALVDFAPVVARLAGE